MRIAFGEGANGVFLINHRNPAVQLRWWYDTVREKYPKEWVGVNFLGLTNEDAWKLTRYSTSGLWVDDGGIRENATEPAALARAFKEQRNSTWDGLYFGGVAFKGQEDVRNPAFVAKLAAPYMDVITTSGPRTGEPPDLEKIKAMRAAVPGAPLAVASGMTEKNIDPYLPFVDCFLVATGISKDFYELDPSLVYRLASKLKTRALA